MAKKPKKAKASGSKKARRGTKQAKGGAAKGKSSKAKQQSRKKTAKGGKAAGKGTGRSTVKGKEKRPSKGSGKGSGKIKKEEGRVGEKRKAELEEQTTKKGKSLSGKQQRKKEITKLYGELINPGRTLKADVLVKDILEALSKRSSTLAEYCSTNLGAHVIEACLKWGTRNQRQDLLSRCSSDLIKMAQDRYGHQVVLKLLLYSSKTSAQRKPTDEEKKAQSKNLREILDKFSGKNLHATFFHRYGCRVINGLYYSTTVKASDKRRLLHSVAIPQAVALRRPELPSSKTLREVLQAEDLTEQQRTAIAQHLQEAVEKAIEKELLGLDIVHLLLQAFCEVATDSQLTQLAEQCMDGAAYLLSSKAGAEALLRLLGIANAKQRKALCRDLKGKFAALAKNAVDYVVMIRLATTVDDTVMLSKSMVAEWVQDMEDLCFDKYGHKVLAWIFQPGDPHLFSPYEQKCASLPSPSSLKEPEARRQELVRMLKPSIRAVFLQKPLEAAGDNSAKDLLAAFLASDWDQELILAIVAAAEAEATKENLGLLNSGTVTTTMLILLKLEPEKGPKLAQPLWEKCLKPQMVVAATSRCAFLLLAMLKRDPIKEPILAALRGKKSQIERSAQDAEVQGAKMKGARQLLEVI
ncbi:unnamed protein product [Durusdinium trenchii]|uniref:PUM-HD domain-containing protein n=1 Tax=Durusdinium trenchii TaxID=1381693 RepID=A0ABP0HDB0_9DINO